MVTQRAILGGVIKHALVSRGYIFDGEVPKLVLDFASSYYYGNQDVSIYADLIDNTTAGAKAVWLSNGDIGSIGANLPRPAYDPVALDFLGHVIEPALNRMNSFYECANGTGWALAGSVTAVNLSLNALGAFDGVEIASGGVVWHTLQETAAVIPAHLGVYKASFLYRAGTSGKVLFGFHRVGGGEILVGGATGSISIIQETGGSVASISETLLSDGVTYRADLEIVADTTAGLQAKIGPWSSVSGETVTALAVVFGGASEELPYCPIIGSDGSTLTVAADAVSLDNGAGLPYVGYDQAQVTAVISVTPLDDASRRIISFNDGTANEVIEVVIDASGNVVLNVVDGGVTQCSINSGVNAVIGTEMTIAFRAGANDFAISVNGGSEVADVAGTMPTVTQLDIGEQCVMSEIVCYDALVANLAGLSTQ